MFFPALTQLLSLPSSVCLSFLVYHYFGLEEGSTELVSLQGVLMCMCVCVCVCVPAASKQRLRSVALAFEHLRLKKRERERHTDEFLFLLLYSASTRFLCLFFCVSSLSFIHSLCYHPTLICHCIFISFVSLFFNRLRFKDLQFSFCSHACV